MTNHADEQQDKGPRSGSGTQPSGRAPDGELRGFEPLPASNLRSTGTATRVSRYRGWIDLSVVPGARSSPPAEKRPCMNEHVLTKVCALLARGSSRYPPRWSARRRRCSPSCSPTLHDTMRPSRASQASRTRNRPHQARLTVCGSACASTCGPTCGSAFALRTERPIDAETAANEHDQDSQTTPDKGWENEKSQADKSPVTP